MRDNLFWKPLLERGFADDGLPWDWTTLGTLSTPEKPVRARLVAKSPGVWAAAGLLQVLAEYGIRAQSKLTDGAPFKKGEVIATWQGPARAVLAAERPFLNLAAYACGVAGATHRFVKAARKACPKQTPRVTLTRKTLPGYRDVTIHAVIAGGGHPHRVSLAGGVLIKENHIAAAGGIAAAITGARARAPHGHRIECEVRDEKELHEALAAGAEVILLDNFSPAQVKRALKLVAVQPRRPVIEVSGGVNEKNIIQYAIPGVDVISVGAITHSVTAADLSLLVEGV